MTLPDHSPREIGRGMCQGNVMTSTEVNHGFGIECLGILCYNLVGAAESGKNIGFQEIHDHLVSGILGGHNLNPLGEIVSGSKDQLMLPTGGWIYLSYEV
jgi:hypothetical protein